MKKLRAALLLLTILLLLCGCAPKDRPTLRVAISPDFAPMEFVDPTKDGQDRFVGFDVSLAKYLAKGLDMELELVPMSFVACQDAVADGSVHMAVSGFSWLPQRDERFNLSVTYHAGDNEAAQVLLIRREDAGRYADAEDLIGQSVGAQTASLQEWLVTQQLPDVSLVSFQSISDGIAGLKNGDFAAMAVAEGNAGAILSEDPDLCKSGFRFHLTQELLDYLILMPKGEDALTESVNALLSQAEKAGYYPQWYAQALKQAGVELHYDDEGNLAAEG